MGRLIAKTEKMWLWLFLLFIPTQLGKHFWPEWSQVLGVRVDYLSVVIYLVDWLWLGLIISKTSISNFQFPISNKIKFLNIIIVIFVLLNILVAGNKGVAVYRWLRIFQWWWFYQYCRKNKKLVISFLKTIIPCWIMIESFLGVAQIVKGGSLGGWWYWLGERRFDFTTIGIAQMSVFGRGLIRAYGTFSHPNSMAGFLLVALAWWIKFKKQIRIQSWWWVVIWSGIIGIIISGSRTVWVLTILMLFWFNYQIIIKNKKRLLGLGLIITGIFILIIALIGVNYQTSDFLGGWDSDGLNKRISLNIVAIKMWKNNLMTGVGLGNFIVRLPEYQINSKFFWLQPVHNIFLLIGSELGILGWLIIILLFRKINTKKSGIWLWLIIITGMLDHYWITLPQNSWLLAIILGII